MRRVGWTWNGMAGVLGAAAVVGLTLLGMVTRPDAHQGDPGDLSLIHACVANRDGAVRIVGPTGACNANKETALHWLKVPSGRFIDLGLTVFDTQTNLQWEKKVAGSGCLHCVGDTFTWCQATGNDAPLICSVIPPSWIAQVNAEAFAGFTDWRLPTGGPFGGELGTILLKLFPCGTSPCIDPIFGPTTSDFYWSATETVPPTDAWAVDFADGSVGTGDKDFLNLVRAVRGGP